MKSTKAIAKLLLTVIISALLLLPVSAFAAENTAPKHTEHIDTTGDGICDIEGCNAALPCTEHTDIDGDGLCDIEGCDKCLTHIDKNSDGKCDRDGCGAKIVVEPVQTTGAKVWESVKIFIIGMIGIFIVVGLIILSIYALNYLINKAQRTKSGEQ